MKKVNLLVLVLTTVSTLAQGEIIFSNRNIPTVADPSVLYHVPIYAPGGRATGTGAGNLPGGVTVELCMPSGIAIASTPLRTGTSAQAQFFALTQTVKVPGVAAGETTNLVVRCWQGSGGFDEAKADGRFYGEWAFTSQPLGGTNASGASFPTPGMTGWGPENGSGFEPLWAPPPIEVAIRLKPGFNLIANVVITTDNSIAGLFKNIAGGVPAGTRIYKLANGKFTTFMWDDLDGRFNPEMLAKTETCYRGDGVFLFLPGSAERMLVFSGLIATSVCAKIPSGFSIISPSYPGSAPMEIVVPPNALGDRIYRYNTLTKNYITYQCDDLDGWSPPLSYLEAGEAFLYFRVGPPVQKCYQDYR